MARYMKLDDVLDAINEVRCSDCSNDGSRDCPLCQVHPIHRKILTKPVIEHEECKKDANLLTYDLPVLPPLQLSKQKSSSEVAREIFEEIDKRFEALLGLYPCNGEFEDANKFVNFHWKYIKRSIMHDYDAELKKKYTEGNV